MNYVGCKGLASAIFLFFAVTFYMNYVGCKEFTRADIDEGVK